jgi:DNA-binding TFAR19-related protein (PDSD5 family)
LVIGAVLEPAGTSASPEDACTRVAHTTQGAQTRLAHIFLRPPEIAPALTNWLRNIKAGEEVGERLMVRKPQKTATLRRISTPHAAQRGKQKETPRNRGKENIKKTKTYPLGFP